MQEHVPSNDRGHTLLLHHIAVQPACIPLLCLSPSFCVLFLFLLVGGILVGLAGCTLGY